MKEAFELELDLLEKTELRIENIKLGNTNLYQFASVVADVLGLSSDEVLVTDVRDNNVTVDILRRTLYADNIFGKKEELLKRLSEVPGVAVTAESSVHSEGILGFIAIDEKEAKEVIERTRLIREGMRSRILKRAIVFSTGFEVRDGMVEDTNTPMIAERLEEEGYQVTRGPTLDDNELRIASSIVKAIDEGYGLILLTGGIGAEDKDRTVEAILKVDSEAATSYITKFQKGTGRHIKDGVRIAVGKVGEVTIVALPGPTQEVKVGLGAAVPAIKEGVDKHGLASGIAGALRERLRARMAHS